jgi:hypothetical protein
LTQLEQKLCEIYVLADKIVHEPTVGISPPAVSQSNVSGYADQILSCVLEAIDDLALLRSGEPIGSPQ